MILRPATMLDASMLLRWKNDPLTMKNSIITSDLIKTKDHLRWLRKHLGEISIIVSNKVPVGDVRISNGEIAIKLDRRFRGKGLGTEVLRMVTDGKKLKAKIVIHNVASLRVFIKNGFLPVRLCRHGKVEYYVLEN